MRLLLGTLLLLIQANASPAAVWMSKEQAARHWFPGSQAPFIEVSLSPQAQASLKTLLKPYSSRGRGWTLPQSVSMQEQAQGWLVLVDEIGKHRPIQYAVAIDPKGAVLGVDVLEYRENYGHQIKQDAFRAQYRGKHWEDPIQSPGDIDAISGATYSCYATNRAVRKALALLKLSGRLP